ncbi:MAG: iron-containing redox enzyme family protein [Bdellovibrionales bacterium]
MINFREAAKQQMDKTGPFIHDYPWENREAYAIWLGQTFYMVNHSTRLVALAGAYAPIERSFLHERFVDHSKEERGHQLIAISDLKALGYQPSDIPALAPSQAMYQVQYYWIQHLNAASFFGYTLALEAIAEYYGPEIHKRVHDAHGPQSAKFIKLHSEADVGHLDEAFRNMDKLNQDEAKLAMENLDLSSDLYREVLIKSKELAETKSIRRAV